MLIGTGIVALTVAVWEYRSLVAISYLWEQEFKAIAGVDDFRVRRIDEWWLAIQVQV
jgi:hypothetical protein